MTIEFIHGEVDSAIISYQSRVSNRLNLEIRGLVMDCGDLGVPYYKLEMLLCVTLARYELLPRQIELMPLVRRGNQKALRDLLWIDDFLGAQNRIAYQTGMLFDIDDPTASRAEEIRGSLTVAIEYFDGEEPAAAEKQLRARLGIPAKKLRVSENTKQEVKAETGADLTAKQQAAKRAVAGFFSVEMIKLFKDRQPHDLLVSKLLDLFSIGVDANDVQHCRAVYLKRINLG